MAQGQPGADSSSPVTSSLIEAATNLFGTAPVFWGRYFTSESTGGTVEYHHASENGPLNSAGIRLLPIARQTGNVAGGQQQGVSDGTANAQDFINTFGVPTLQAQGGAFLMFLDVEGSPSLSLEYYTGWTQGLANQAEALGGGAVQMLPCVYATQSDTTTWNAVQDAMNAGVPCHGGMDCPLPHRRV